ncbi:amino acid ABC transporter permease [Marinithermus hydrothermalis]|uniref:Polar amino acid ABC transporter, inner membrane subunit n=1 Tax=Marinithermus hydrothermalis (strain DSM 14884 / JCM 11576 / T1) TaxID=869210 RepID=F2NPC5_MARHT|nr:ABC transporter permease subunit [Marinithermus hydrothermalis]AEB12206.1 polar amino acid ABC transporter, inner membrane subunit [Marinithermus hydrothermalis DSM 14884]
MNRRTIPFWRDARVLNLVVQVLAALFALGLIAFLLFTAYRGMVARGIPFTFSFLGQEAGFTISEGPVLALEDGRLVLRPFKPSDAYWQAFFAGIYNTLRVALVGIVLTTILGVLVGIGRLSSNWLVNRLAFAYVELVRNTPLLVQMFFWYFGAILKFPPVRQASEWFGGLIASQRGIFLPWPVPTDAWPRFEPFLWGGLLLAVGVYLALRRQGWARWSALGALVLAWGVGWLVSGGPLAISEPELGRFRVTGGLTLSPEFSAVLLALVIYTASYIAEIVRGAIQSLPKGQWEAATSLGLTYAQTMRLVILPQAMRIIIPPLGNQYLNLTKNSSLAIAVGYPELFNVYGTIANQSGRSLEGILIVMAAYLSMSLTISALVNWYNRRVTLVGVR